MHISLITSLYRSAAFLPMYLRQVSAIATQLAHAHLDLELIIISNDTTPTEKRLLTQFQENIQQHPNMTLNLLYTPRENLYASWNRALAQMQGRTFGFWNVDDVRHGDALIASYRLLEHGATLVDAPMRVVREYRLGGVTIWRQSSLTHILYHPQLFTRKQTLSPFAMMHRDLYAQVGEFDSHFKVSGDIEWGYRARAHARFAPLSIPGGTFYLHGGNLSSTGGERQMVEDNIAFLRAQIWQEVRPTPAPQLMRELWEDWGNPQGITLPLEIADLLWGTYALEQWQQWQQAHQRHLQQMRWRTLPRAVINRLKLRAHLARWGIVKNKL